MGAELRRERPVLDRKRAVVDHHGRRAAAAVAACLLGGALSATVHAAAPPAAAPAINLSHTFAHGYFEYTAAAGTLIADHLTLTNAGSAGGTFRIYPSDGVTSPATGVVYAPGQNPFPDGPGGNGEYGAGRWITMSAASATLGVRASTRIDFTVDVPMGTHPGDWVGSANAETSRARGGTSGPVGFNVTTRTTIAVVIHVPGAVDTTSVVIGTSYITVGPAGQVLNIPLQYDGDVLLKPVMHFTITDARGNVLASFDGQYDTFMPHTTLLYAYPLGATHLGAATYTFSGDFGSPAAPRAFSSSFTVGPAQTVKPPPVRGPAIAHATPPAWLLPVIALSPALLLLLLVLLIVARRRCTHCGSRMRRLIRACNHDEIAGCRSCRTLAKERKPVRLCGACYRDHVKVAVLATTR